MHLQIRLYILHTTISFIGAGKVSTTLGIYFKKRGFEIGGYYSRNLESAKRAAVQTDSRPFKTLNELIDESDMVWITTPDDQIGHVVEQITSVPISDENEKVVLHASGAHSIAVLSPLADAGFNVACAHPLMAFNNIESSVQKIGSAWFATEEMTGNDFSLEAFFKLCGNKTFKIGSDKKTLYHAAACVLSNYMVTLLDASYRIFEQSGMTKEDIQAATTPLLESVLENLKGKSCADALTGPIRRGDAKTVEMHLQNLNAEMPAMVELYKLLGRHTMQMTEDYRLKNILD